MRRLPQNTLILTTEPFVGYMPADLRAWLNTNNRDTNLATALAAVNNHVGLLGYSLDETDDPWLLYAYEAWWEVELELYDLIFSSMKRSNQLGETDYDFNQGGLYYRVAPFMERNGFQDGAGWWIQASEKLNGPAILIG